MFRQCSIKNKLITVYFRSSWNTDPYSCGSYSHLTIECEKHGLLPSILAEPEYASTFCEEVNSYTYLKFLFTFINTYWVQNLYA